MNERTTRLWQAPVCPKCAALLNGATNFHGHAPEPGDVTICIYCRSVLMFTEGLGLRAVLSEEIDEWHPDEVRELRVMAAALASVPPRPPPHGDKA